MEYSINIKNIWSNKMTDEYKKQLDVYSPTSKLRVMHNDKELTFLNDIKPIHNFNGEYTFGLSWCMEDIKKHGLERPTTAEIVSLIYGAFNSDNKESQEIIKVLTNWGILSFTGNLYIPGKGVYIQDNPKIKVRKTERIGNSFGGGSVTGEYKLEPHPYTFAKTNLEMEESELVKKLESNDSSVRFVPFGFAHHLDKSSISRHPYVLASAGEEGAEKLSEMASNYKYGLLLNVFTSVYRPFKSLCIIRSDKDKNFLTIDSNTEMREKFNFEDKINVYTLGIEKEKIK
jgi:hypothetical protein